MGIGRGEGGSNVVRGGVVVVVAAVVVVVVVAVVVGARVKEEGVEETARLTMGFLTGFITAFLRMDDGANEALGLALVAGLVSFSSSSNPSYI